MFIWYACRYTLLYFARLTFTTLIAFLLWAYALYEAPHLVLWIAKYAGVLQGYIVQLLAQVAPPLAALLVSLPVTLNLIFLTFFIPTLVVVQAFIGLFKKCRAV